MEYNTSGTIGRPLFSKRIPWLNKVIINPAQECHNKFLWFLDPQSRSPRRLLHVWDYVPGFGAVLCHFCFRGKPDILDLWAEAVIVKKWRKVNVYSGRLV